jgi:predicted nucleic acid-binding Zn ribbon protein
MHVSSAREADPVISSGMQTGAALIWITVAFIIACSAIILLIYLSRNFFFSGGASVVIEAPPGKKSKLPCILCGAALARGETLKSDEFKSADHSTVHIHGCPHCRDGARPRTCPVCGRTMPEGDYLTGRMWITRKGKKHLHVSGCTQCAGRKGR